MSLVAGALGTKDLPLPHERESILALIALVDENVQDLDVEIAKLVQRRTALLDRRAIYLGDLSPLRHFPAEILVTIFSYIISGDAMQIVILSHVCQFWRRVILDSSILWTHIEIGTWSCTPRSKAVRREYFNTVLARNRNLRPISLKMNKHNCPQCFDIRSIFEELRGEVIWGSISLELDNSLLLPTLFMDNATNTESWKELTHFSIDVRRLVDSGPTAFETSPTMVAPKLASLRIYTPESLKLSNIIFSWSQLKSLTFKTHQFLEESEVYDVLIACTQLEDAWLANIVPGDSMDDGERGKIRLDHLLKLRLEIGLLPATILQTLDTPCLQELHLKCTSLINDLDDYDFCNYINTCSPTLRKLHIPCAVGLISLFSAEDSKGMDLLEELAVDGAQDSTEYSDPNCDYLLEGLRIDPQKKKHRHILPRLQVLRIVGQTAGNSDSSLGLFFTALKSRIGAIRFAAFEFAGPDLYPSSLRSEAVKAGLDDHRITNRVDGHGIYYDAPV